MDLDRVKHQVSRLGARTLRGVWSMLGHAAPHTHRIGKAPWARIGLWTAGALGGLVLALIAVVAFADWNAMKGPISRFASNATGRDIVITGDLDIEPFSFTPQARLEGLRIGNPGRYRDRGDFAAIGEARVAVRLLPLLLGKLDIIEMDVAGVDLALYRNADGDGNWNSDPDRDRGKPFDLPAIKRFSVRDGRVRFVDDKRNLDLDANFTTDESAGDESGRFELSGEGSINRRPFAVELSGAPLLNVRRGRPYAFTANVRAGDTRVKADGRIHRPFNLSGWDAEIVASGANLADLYPLIGLALPNTPPYALRGHLSRENQVYGMEALRGRVGDSDLRGAFTARRQADDRLMLDGDFQSARLDFDDMLTVLGAPPSTERGETASPAQRAQAAQLAAQGRVLPDANLDISRVRNMDARVSYHAARVVSDTIPLRGMTIGINLDHGLLTLDPLTLDLRQGRVSGVTSINAREEGPPLVNLDMRLTGARMESIIALNGNPPLTGALVGRARLSARGASARDAAAAANGNISFAIPSGEVRESLAELTGINVTRGLGLLLSDDESEVPIRCGVASFRVESGIAHSRTILIDTENIRIGGHGRINLRDETFDLSLQGEPKEPRLIRVAAPITLQGHWRSPHVGVAVEDALDQGGIAALFATLLAPVAVILPFLDAGLAEDANCSALLAGRPQPAETN
jgi:uncharacterized protein involved in outer membrane biogenesis